jgi:hypothetical protein
MMSTRWHVAVAVAALLMALGVAAPARAQVPLANPAEKPAELTREAFASPYGRAMVAEFNTVLRASADPACLQSKKLKAGDLEKRGEALITKWSIHAMEVLASFINILIYETTLAKSAGVGADAELKRLQAHPDVKRYLTIERPRRLALVLDYVFEQFSRFVLIHRIKLGQVSPLATGNEILLRANPTEKVEAELEQFLKVNTSPQVRHYLELNEQVAAARRPRSTPSTPATTSAPRPCLAGSRKISPRCACSTAIIRGKTKSSNAAPDPLPRAVSWLYSAPNPLPSPCPSRAVRPAPIF